MTGGPDVDLVVAGAGGGLVGALRAARRGARVLVVEASRHYLRGNNTSMCTAMIPGVNTRWQRELGIQDSPELFAGDVEHKTKGGADLALATALARVSPDMVEWLADEIGLPIELMTDLHYPGHAVDRLHTIPERHGSALLAHLSQAAQAHPNIDFLVPARLTDVELDASGGVAAAVVTDPDGHDETVSTPAVLLATNGYGADRELVQRHMPEIAAATYHGSETSRGDALRIGQRLGAATAYLDAYQGHGALAAGASTLLGWATIMHGGVMLDRTGRRFGKETSGYSEFGPWLAARPGAVGWVVYDRRVHDLCLPFTDFRNCVEAGVEVWADDAAALAHNLGLPGEAVVAELAESDAAARGEVADRFGRTYEAPLTAPYAAVKVLPALFHTQGGLVVDDAARVVRADGSVIAGLYASGGAANGISGHGADGYLAGNGLLTAFGLAYAAGTDAS
ncbi:MAG TPA: FAD-binding protein [Pseudonocardiaceae bacterium]|nr:FAD-binding protein [Pseudonocardiaceae bacterium]